MKKPLTLTPINAGSMVNQSQPVEPVIRLNWNYEQLDGETREAAIAATIRMKRTDAAAGELAWEIGRDLIEQKERVGHGNWLDWLATEMGYSDATAENLMRIYRTFPELGELRRLGRSALTLLASNSTPPAVKEAVKEAVATGATVTHKEIKAMKEAVVLSELSPSQMSDKQVREALTEWEAKGWKMYSRTDKFGFKMYRMVHEADQTATMSMNDPRGVLRVLRGSMHKSYAQFEQWRAEQAEQAKQAAAKPPPTSQTQPAPPTSKVSAGMATTTPTTQAAASSQAPTAPAAAKRLDHEHIDDACVDLMAMLEDCQDEGYPVAQAHNLIEQLSLLRKWLAKYAKQ